MIVDLRCELKVNELRFLSLIPHLDGESVPPGVLSDQELLVQALAQAHLTRSEAYDQISIL